MSQLGFSEFEPDTLAQEIEQAMQYYDWFHNVLPRQELILLGNLSAAPRTVAATPNTRKSLVRIFAAAILAGESKADIVQSNNNNQPRLLFFVPLIDLIRFFYPSQSLDVNQLLHQLPANEQNYIQTLQTQSFGRIQLPKQSILLDALGTEQLLQLLPPLDLPAQSWSKQVLLPALYGNTNLIVPPRSAAAPSTERMNQAKQYQTQLQTLQTFLGPTPTMIKYPGLFGLH